MVTHRLRHRRRTERERSYHSPLTTLWSHHTTDLDGDPPLAILHSPCHRREMESYPCHWNHPPLPNSGCHCPYFHCQFHCHSHPLHLPHVHVLAHALVLDHALVLAHVLAHPYLDLLCVYPHLCVVISFLVVKSKRMSSLSNEREGIFDEKLASGVSVLASTDRRGTYNE